MSESAVSGEHRVPDCNGGEAAMFIYAVCHVHFCCLSITGKYKNRSGNMKLLVLLKISGTFLSAIVYSAGGGLA